MESEKELINILKKDNRNVWLFLEQVGNMSVRLTNHKY
jgi:uncharacterized protein YejL (UPF0352 family)